MQYLDKSILKEVIKPRPKASHKGTFGRALIIGGNEMYGGAVILAGKACVYAGCGLTTVMSKTVNHSAIHAHSPEIIVADSENAAERLAELMRVANVIAIGCGLGESAESLNLLKMTLSEHNANQWLIIDGSAINLFAKCCLKLSYPEKTIFTPHEKELERLSNIPIAKQSVGAIQEFTDGLGATIIAKSSETKIFTPKCQQFAINIGVPAMATGGMGDTLVGILAAFLAQFRETPAKSVQAAIYLHSYIAADLAKSRFVTLPSRIIEEIPVAMK